MSHWETLDDDSDSTPEGIESDASDSENSRLNNYSSSNRKKLKLNDSDDSDNSDTDGDSDDSDTSENKVVTKKKKTTTRKVSAKNKKTAAAAKKKKVAAKKAVSKKITKNKKTSTLTKSSSESKRPVGRPRLVKTVVKPVIRGIIDTPIRENSKMEFNFTDPQQLKIIWTFFKSQNATNTKIVFSEDRINIFCVDHLNKIISRFTIDCALVDLYYCDGEVEYSILVSEMIGALAMVDTKIQSIILTADKENLQKHMDLMLELKENRKEAYHYKIRADGEAVNIDEKTITKLNDSKNFITQFTLSSGTATGISKWINQSKSKKVTFSQTGPDEDFNIKIDNGSYRSLDKKSRKLITTMGEDDTLLITTEASYLKPILCCRLSKFIVFRLFKTHIEAEYLFGLVNGKHVIRGQSLITLL
jgi:hypothetical protein